MNAANPARLISISYQIGFINQNFVKPAFDGEIGRYIVISLPIH